MATRPSQAPVLNSKIPVNIKRIVNGLGSIDEMNDDSWVSARFSKLNSRSEVRVVSKIIERRIRIFEDSCHL